MLLVIISLGKELNRIPVSWGQVLLEAIFKYLIEEKHGGKGNSKVKITNGHKLKCLWGSVVSCKLVKQGADKKLWKNEAWLQTCRPSPYSLAAHVGCSHTAVWALCGQIFHFCKKKTKKLWLCVISLNFKIVAASLFNTFKSLQAKSNVSMG